MAIHSNEFGGVTLTDNDAQTFKRQVAHGKPKAAAKAGVVRGVALAKEFRSSGRKLTLRVTAKNSK